MSRRRKVPRQQSWRSSHKLNAGLLGVAGLLASVPLQAQQAPAPPAPPPKVNQPAAASPGYVDKVMDTPPTDGDALQLKLDTYDESGWARGWRVESGFGSQRGLSRTQTQSLAVSGFLETPDYGIFSVNVNRASSSSVAGTLLSPDSPSISNSGTTWRVDQRGLALGGGWVANHSVGNVGTTGVPLSRGVSRTILPFTPIRGFAGQWSLSDVVDVNASFGEVGAFSGFDLSGFRPTGGQVSSAGAQLRLGRDPATGGASYAAVQLIDVRNQRPDPLIGNSQSTRGIYTAASFEGRLPWADEAARGPANQSPAERVGDFRIQGNLLQSNQSVSGLSTGAWADAQWRTERWRQSAGVFRFEPMLRWGEALLASDLQGAYWRADTTTRQWQFGASGEYSNAVSGRDAASAFFSSYVRYRIDSRNSLNTTVNLRALTNPASSVSVVWDQQNRLGQTQWRAEQANINGVHTIRFGADQSLALAAPSALSASLAWDRTTGNLSRPAQGWGWGLLGTLSPASRLTLDGSLRGFQSDNGTSAIDANLALSWQLGGGWTTALRYSESRGQQTPVTLLTSALTTALLPPVVTNVPFRNLQLTLRYEGRAGSSSRPIGGAGGDGAGGISGTVFFDDDNNGRREASEGGVPAVTVVLDRRYVTRTDAQGRYEFPYVSATTHLIEVSSDNVPLPWSPVLREPVSVDVTVRAVTVQDFAVQRAR